MRVQLTRVTDAPVVLEIRILCDPQFKVFKFQAMFTALPEYLSSNAYSDF
jgi:hypothetical protein